jgi:hypothetical protein
MTVGNHTMDHKEENDFFDLVEKLNKTGNAFRFIVWALAGLVSCGLLVAGWVWRVNETQISHGSLLNEHTHLIKDMDLKSRGLDTWKATSEANPKVTQADLFSLERRLQKTEDQLTAIKEQNVFILETIRRIDKNVSAQ